MCRGEWFCVSIIKGMGRKKKISSFLLNLILVPRSWSNTLILCSVWAWWSHQMETFSALLTLCEGNPPVTDEFPTQRPVTRGFEVFFDLRLNKRLSKQSWVWWFETPSRSLWRHCNGKKIKHNEVIARKRFPHYGHNVRWNHRSPGDSRRKGPVVCNKNVIKCKNRKHVYQVPRHK